MPIKLFVRVKERIIPEQCFTNVHTMSMDIHIVKENKCGIEWNQLEPNEYSAARPMLQSLSSPTSLLSITNRNPILSSLNRSKF